MHRRASGILLHITSLPSPFGVGDLGPGARNFADFLVDAGQSCWQILPLSPTSTYIGNSPYSSDSAFAGNPLLVSPEYMVRDGWLAEGDIEGFPSNDPDRADFPAATAFKDRLLDLAFSRHALDLPGHCAFGLFRQANASWLGDYALFRAIKQSMGGMAWTRWPAELRDRDASALAERREDLAESVLREEFRQFLFFDQWAGLKGYLSERDILVIGDAPIYVTQDSADVWANPTLFKLGPGCEPRFVAGVPPDYFSRTGQRWGNPVYDWKAHVKTGFSWWVERLRRAFALYDFVRLDHFRGFAGYWEIPAKEKTAEKGEWVPAPGKALFKALLGHFPQLPILAEDLGVITPDVRELRDGFGFPGMLVLQFCFGPGIGDNHDAPHNHVENAVVYTGTHDNNTTLGWLLEDAGEQGRRALMDYLGREVAPADVPWTLLRLALMSVARLAVVPMQDILSLGPEARMNTPSLAKGNWSWRCRAEAFTPALAAKLKAVNDLFGRGRMNRVPVDGA